MKYGSPLDPLRLNSFYTQPRTVKEAQDKGWIQPPETLNEVNIQTFCEENDPRICILFDAKGSIAGYQIAVSTVISFNKINSFSTYSLEEFPGLGGMP